MRAQAWLERWMEPERSERPPYSNGENYWQLHRQRGTPMGRESDSVPSCEGIPSREGICLERSPGGYRETNPTEKDLTKPIGSVTEDEPPQSGTEPGVWTLRPSETIIATRD